MPGTSRCSKLRSTTVPSMSGLSVSHRALSLDSVTVASKITYYSSILYRDRGGKKCI